MAYSSREIIEMLLDAGADANTTTYHGETPFHWAARHQKQRTKQFMQWLRTIEAEWKR
jgi:ankyrin repeat protein